MEIQSRRKNKKLTNATISAILVGVFAGTSLTAGTATALWSDNTEVQGVTISTNAFFSGEVENEGTDGNVVGEVELPSDGTSFDPSNQTYTGKAYEVKLNPVKGIDVQKTGEAKWDMRLKRNSEYNTIFFDFEGEWAEIRDGSLEVFRGKCSDKSSDLISKSEVVKEGSTDQKTRLRTLLEFDGRLGKPEIDDFCVKAKLPESSAKHYGVIGVSDNDVMTTFVGDDNGSTYKNDVTVNAKDPNTGKTTSGADSWETKILRFPNPIDVKAYVEKNRDFEKMGVCYVPPSSPSWGTRVEGSGRR